MDRLFNARGWSDGLPLVPPTPERVHRILTGTDRQPSEVLGSMPPRFGEATVEKIAINSLMAGCGPEHLPVILAAVEAMLADEFNLYGCQATTHVVSPLLILNGPIVSELGASGGYNCFGQGHRSNALIGRAIRLILTNVGGAIPGKLDRATFGTPAKFAYCVAENEAENPWQPLQVERGFDSATSTVTLVGAEAPHNINDHGSISADGLLTTVAQTMCQPGTNNVYYYQEGPWVALSPEHAALVAADGWTKTDVKRFLFEQSKIPIIRFSRENVERFLLHRWPAWLQEEVRAWLAGEDRDVRVPIAGRAEDIGVIVAGGAGKHSLFIPTFGATRSVTRPLLLQDGSPAQSVKDFARR
ncbi:MAG: hypothetical protein KGJ86_07305 [Chloroflexota bacterium]|nr:hypothetical protein [Chloroflexota bacterium]